MHLIPSRSLFFFYVFSDRSSKNWKEINLKDGKKKYRRIRYLLFFLTTIYVPVTRNGMDLLLCAPKYAYSKYACVDNITGVALGRTFFAAPMEATDPESCVDHYIFLDIPTELPTTPVSKAAACSTITSTSTPSLSDICLPNNLNPCQKAGCTDYTGKLNSSSTSLYCAGDKCAATDVKTCCAVQGDIRFFEFTIKDNCDANGRDQITSKTECVNAARALGYSTSIETQSSSLNPAGCWYDATFNDLMWNTGSGSMGECSDRKKCFCQKASDDVYFQFTSNNGCTSNSKSDISSSNECVLAAAARGINYTGSVTSTTSALFPSGCSKNVGSDTLYFSTATENYDFCSATEICLCKKSRRRLEQVEQLTQVDTRRLNNVANNTSASSVATELICNQCNPPPSASALNPDGEFGGKGLNKAGRCDYFCSSKWNGNTCGQTAMYRTGGTDCRTAATKSLSPAQSSSVDNRQNNLVAVTKPGTAVKLLVLSSFPGGCHQGDHMLYVLLAFIILSCFSVGFPKLMFDMVKKEIPKPMSPNGKFILEQQQQNIYLFFFSLELLFFT